MACATLVRGIASFENTVTPASASDFTTCGNMGPLTKHKRTWPSCMCLISSSVGLATLTMKSASP